MKIVKPFRIGLLSKPLLHGGTVYLSVGLLHYFPFADPRRIQTEQEMWTDLGPALGNVPLDPVHPKLRGEVLVWGSYFAPDGEPMLQHGVRLAIGPVDKVVRVTGPRQWVRGDHGGLLVSDPEPVTSLPLVWPLAFGGPGFADNPTGRGHWPADQEPVSVSLPCLEYPDDPLARPHDIVAPAGFAPRDMMLPDRQKKIGTYDRYWLDHHCPGWPQDLDWSFFQEAPEDQQFPGPLAGTEDFIIEHMHPDQPVQTGRLPGVRGRCFVWLKRGADGHERETVEIPLQADTLCLFPALERGVVIEHGLLPVSEADLDDVEGLLAAFEWLEDAPRSQEYYEGVYAFRTDRQKAATPAYVDFTDLSPDGWQEPPPEQASWFATLTPMPAELPPSLERRLNAHMADFKSFFDQVPDPTAPEQMANSRYHEPESVQEVRRELEALGAMQSSRDMDALNVQVARIEQALRKMDEDLTDDSLRKARAMCERFDLDFDKLTAEAAANAPKSPIDALGIVDQQVAEFAKAAPEAYRAAILSASPKPFADSVKQVWDDLQALQRRTQATVGHVMPKPPPLPPAALERGREELEEALAGGQPLTGRGMAGFDLSGMDLSGRDLSNGDFTGCRLVGTDFRHAVLTGATFAHADLTGADLTGVVARETSFAKTDLTDARMADAVLADSNFSGATGARPVLAGADLTGALLMETHWQDADLSGCRLEGANLLQATLPGLNAERAVLIKVFCNECVLTGASLVGAQLQRVSFVSCRLDGSDLSGCQVSGLATAGSMSLRSCRFDRAVLTGATFIGADLSQCSFIGAMLDTALFNNADLFRSDLSGCDASRALFIRANLREARLDRSDFKEANLMKADLTDASARETSFWSADTTGAIWEACDLTGAHLAKTRLAEPNFHAD